MTVWRWLAGAAVLAVWVRDYLRTRRAGLRRTRREFERLRGLRPEVFARHYNERVPTVEEELAVWGPYHRHRHQMRYDLVARAVRDHVPAGGRVVDVGCGSMNVADRLLDLPIEYVGTDFGAPHIAYAARKYGGMRGELRARFVRCDAEALAVSDGGADVAVCTEVVEHLVRPERALWEIARVLRPGGTLVLTTNNACEVPLATPLRRPGLWAERALAVRVPAALSYRAWVWPQPVDAELTDGGEPAYVPHTHHIAAELRGLLEAAGLRVVTMSTFEFPPPHSRTAALLARGGGPGLRAADAIERAARAAPLLRWMGTHLFVVAARGASVPAAPPAAVWPGPFSGAGELSRLERARWPKRPRPVPRG